jgi:curved DNA-binding protein CbpA
MTTQGSVDPYATLGVERGASIARVRDAYRRLAKRHHPDVQDDAQADERMRRINQAWEMLSDPVRKRQHNADVARASAATSGHWGAGGAAYAYRPPPATATRPAWATYRGIEPESDGEGGPLRWGMLLLIVPVFVLSAAILGAGILPFPLFGLLLILLVSRLAGGER